jgi:hypothetical protein
MQGTLYKNIDPDTPEWFLRNMIQVGDLTVLVGPEGSGKDIFGTGLVGCLTTGKPLPDGEPAQPAGSAIMITPEDAANYTTRPRLDAAGADNDRVLDLTYVQRGTATDNASDVFSIADDIGVLRDAILGMPDCQLVWISPLNYTAGINVRSNDNTIRRRIIGPLQALARETGVAIVLVHHFTKDGAVAGSKAITDAPRTVLELQRDPNNPEIRAVGVRKTNIAADVRPIRYVIEGTQPYSFARFLEDAGEGTGGLEEPVERGKRPRPGTGQARVLEVLEGSMEPVTSQHIMKETGIDHMIVKVYLNRLIEAAWAERVGRNQYVAKKVTVTTPDLGEHLFASVTSNGVTVLGGR